MKYKERRNNRIWNLYCKSTNMHRVRKGETLKER